MAGRATSRKAKKCAVIAISSSSSSGEESERESESNLEDYDPSSNYTTSCDDYDDEDDYREENEGTNEESMSNRVIRLLREKIDLEELTLMECKAYLRRHGLRLSGTRVECILRIKEHWRLKDGKGETLYPRSSFTINCTGDVCKGDVVLFTQKVHKNFQKVTNRGNLLGKRTVAGRIVKESYGAAKQQHTFTVDVLWSKGVKKLTPLFPLLVKGRNLYKMKTFRQRWQNEKERLTVLGEKHERGAAARLIRETRRKNAVKRTWKISSKNEGGNRQKHFQHSSSPLMRMRGAVKVEKHADERGKVPARNQKCNYYHRKGPPFEQPNVGENTKPRALASHLGHWDLIPPVEVGESSRPPYAYPQCFTLSQSNQYHQKDPYFFSSSKSASSTNWSVFGPHPDPFFVPSSARQDFVHHGNHHYGRPTHGPEWRNGNYFSRLTNTTERSQSLTEECRKFCR